MNNNFQQQWENILTPELLRSNLISASIYITTFEIMKNSIITRVQDFYKFTNSWLQEKDLFANPQYQNDVLNKDKRLVYASLQWLKESQAVSDNDIKTFNQTKRLRNLLAHEFPKMLTEGLPSELPERYNDMVSLLNKIEKWWIINFEIPVNPDIAGKDIDEKEIIPGPILSLQILLDVALGSEESARSYIDVINKLKKTK
jgi:hypothetical protein